MKDQCLCYRKQVCMASLEPVMNELANMIGHGECGASVRKMTLSQCQRRRIPAPDRARQRIEWQVHGVQLAPKVDRAAEYLLIRTRWSDTIMLEGDAKWYKVVTKHEAECLHGEAKALLHHLFPMSELP